MRNRKDGVRERKKAKTGQIGEGWRKQSNNVKKGKRSTEGVMHAINGEGKIEEEKARSEDRKEFVCKEERRKNKNNPEGETALLFRFL